jgi:hypothetical protein
MNYIKNYIPSTFDPIFKAILTDKELKNYLCYLISEVPDLNYKELYNNIRIENSKIPVKYIKQKAYQTDLVVKLIKIKII